MPSSTRKKKRKKEQKEQKKLDALLRESIPPTIPLESFHQYQQYNIVQESSTSYMLKNQPIET
tara:strand:+ start:115 stop:303 length:189 start_codon:yes stop_codon:yes gene_type:complete